MNLEFKGDFFKHLEKVNKHAFLKQMTSEAGALATTFSKERFRYKNWLDKSREPWKKRKRKERKGSLMVKSGRLKRSVRKIAQGNYYVLIGTDVPYAQIHNEGGTVKATVNVRAHKRTRNTYALRKRRKAGQSRYTTKKTGSITMDVKAHKRNINFTMPKRQFLGESAFLVKKIERYMLRSINKTINFNQ